MDTKRWLLAGCALVLAFLAAVVALVVLVVSPPLFFRLLALLGVGMTVLSVVAMVRTTRRSTTVSTKAQLLSIAVSALSVLVFAGLLGVRVGPLVWLAALLFGGLLGAAWSFATRLRLEGGLVRRQGGVAHLAIWGAVFLLQQLLAVALGRVPASGMVLLLFGTGLVVGQSATLLARASLLRRGVA